MSQTKTTIVTLSILLGILLLGAITIAILNHQQAKRELATSDAAVALSSDVFDTQYTDLAGNRIDLGQYVGQVLIVISWASWSPQSAQQLDVLTTIAQEYQADEITVVAINRAEPRATAEAFLQSIGVREQVKLIIDNTDAYYSRIGGYTMPETLIYDTNGDVLAHYRGILDSSDLRRNIELALQGE